MKRTGLSIIGACLMMFSASSLAASFDFLAAANPEVGGDPLVIASNTAGISIEATGSFDGVDADAVAYLDYGGGLGVCSTGLTASKQCIDSSDDMYFSGGTDTNPVSLFDESDLVTPSITRNGFGNTVPNFNGGFQFKYNSSGDLLWNKTITNLESPSISAVDIEISNGSLWLSANSQSATYLYKYDSQGNNILEHRRETSLSNIGIFIDEHQNIFDISNDSIFKYNSD